MDDTLTKKYINNESSRVSGEAMRLGQAARATRAIDGGERRAQRNHPSSLVSDSPTAMTQVISDSGMSLGQPEF